MAGKLNQKKRVPVKFVGDQDVFETIICATSSSKNNESFLPMQKDEKDDLPPLGGNVEIYRRPSALLEENEANKNGSEVFIGSRLDCDESSGSDEDSDMDHVQMSAKKPKQDASSKSEPHSTKKTPSRTPFWKSMADEYFLMSSQKSNTSKRTLSSSALATNEQMLKKVKQLSSTNPHSKHIQQLTSQYKDNFVKWINMLRHGFNLLFYGYGSKHSIISDFCKEMLQDKLHMVVNGFFPGLTIKNLLNTIMEEIMEDSSPYQGLNDKVSYIKEYFKSSDSPDFYLVIHNIDGIALQSEKAQLVLNQLAQASRIHLISSVDHVNCSLLWNQIMMNRFKWLWLEVTTFQPYDIETSYEDSLLAQHTAQLSLNSLRQVFNSLTSNAQGIFLTIANYQVEKSVRRKHIGLSFQDCYLQCAEAFLVSSDLGLRTQLTEFKDHKLLQLRKGSDGVDYLYIPLDNDTLKQFLEENNG